MHMTQLPFESYNTVIIALDELPRIYDGLQKNERKLDQFFLDRFENSLLFYINQYIESCGFSMDSTLSQEPTKETVEILEMITAIQKSRLQYQGEERIIGLGIMWTIVQKLSAQNKE